MGRLALLTPSCGGQCADREEERVAHGNEINQPLGNTLRKALLETVTVNERGKTKLLPKIDVAIRQQTNKAAAGDPQALKLLTSLLLGPAGSSDDAEQVIIVIDDVDSRLLLARSLTCQCSRVVSEARTGKSRLVLSTRSAFVPNRCTRASPIVRPPFQRAEI